MRRFGGEGRGECSRTSPLPISSRRGWPGRPPCSAGGRLFLRHFHRTSVAALDERGEIAGFLVGFVSPSESAEAHTHFIAVSPDSREAGLGRALYGEFFALTRAQGCRTVTAVVAPINNRSARFHRAVGFTPTPLPAGEDAQVRVGDEELPVWRDWDGPGADRIRFRYAL